MKKIIGLTGNIASGKSEAEKIFEKNNIPVINADNIVKKLLEPNTNCYKKINKHFEKHPEFLPIIKLNSKQLDKHKLRNIIYKHKKQKEIIESIIHPEVQKILREFAENFKNNKNQKADFCVLSIPLLFSKKNYEYINQIIYIDVSYDTQISRLIARDNINKDLAEKMIASQPSRESRIKQCDIIIENNKNLKDLEEQIKYNLL